MAKTIPPARTAALQALGQILTRNEVHAQAALDTAIEQNRLQPRDRGLATELVYGFLRLKSRAEFVISLFVEDPTRVPSQQRLVLYLAAHEIMHLDKVPSYATVDWAVDASKQVKSGSKGLSGMFNAVLRKVAALKEAPREIEFYEQEGLSGAELLSVYYACPEWIIDLWLKAYGEETTHQYLRAQVAPPALGLNLWNHPNAKELFSELVGSEQLIDLDGWGVALGNGARIPFIKPPMKRQSYAAREVLMALDPQSWPGPVWDGCAGRGGKTRLLRELGVDVMLASDVHRGRLRALERELKDVGTAEMDAATDSLNQKAGTALLDLPCSGLGVISRRPDTKWNRTQEDVVNLVELQQRILDNGARNVKPGGMLAVVTCTLNPAENEEQINGFLERHPGAKLKTSFTTPARSPLGEFFYGALIQL